MNTSEAITYLESDIKRLEYEKLKIDDFEIQEIIKNIRKSSIFQLLKSFDWIISNVKHTEDWIDKSRQSTDFNLHTDWLYYKDVPEIIGLYCENQWRWDTTTYLCETSSIIKGYNETELGILNKLEYTYIWRDWGLHTRDLIEIDPLSWEKITNLSAKWYISPYKFLWTEIPDFFDYMEICHDLNKKIKNSICYEHTWEKWDFLLINNNKYLHWRKWREVDLKRSLFRAWIRVNNSQI